jgi:hypothetical protein
LHPWLLFYYIRYHSRILELESEDVEELSEEGEERKEDGERDVSEPLRHAHDPNGKGNDCTLTQPPDPKEELHHSKVEFPDLPDEDNDEDLTEDNDQHDPNSNLKSKWGE